MIVRHVERLNMKLFKLTAMMALLFALVVNLAHANPGRIDDADNTGNKICVTMAAEARKKEALKAKMALAIDNEQNINKVKVNTAL